MARAVPFAMQPKVTHSSRVPSRLLIATRLLQVWSINHSGLLFPHDLSPNLAQQLGNPSLVRISLQSRTSCSKAPCPITVKFIREAPPSQYCLRQPTILAPQGWSMLEMLSFGKQRDSANTQSRMAPESARRLGCSMPMTSFDLIYKNVKRMHDVAMAPRPAHSSFLFSSIRCKLSHAGCAARRLGGRGHAACGLGTLRCQDRPFQTCLHVPKLNRSLPSIAEPHTRLWPTAKSCLSWC
jgi:hypothetical protein